MGNDTPPPVDFIRRIILADNASGKHGGRVATRFPPEPNGFLHIGHAKSICLNFGIAREFGGSCNLRFDDTNPLKEEQAFIDAIEEDVRWLGYEWDGLYYASDYFPRLYDYAEELIRLGQAYVCSLSPEEMRLYRGTLTEPGMASPYRERSVEENLELFRRMRAGEFPDGSHVLRAKIDMASPNLNMRDPTLYRIRRTTHHQTGDQWRIYPMYDYTHCLSDAIEGITHSLCTLEFEDHRPLYDWVLETLGTPHHPRQIEFARLQLEYTVLSKRKLTILVNEGHVNGWDDPRLPTIAGLRRRGYTPASIREFCSRIGVAKADNRVEMGQLENCLREDLDQRAPRAMAVLRPLKVVLENFPADGLELLEAANHPKDPTFGTRQVPLTREILIEREDFIETAPKGWKRLTPGGEVRLRYGYVIRCDRVITDPDSGEVVELRCSYDPATLGANPEGRKVAGVIHWVSATRSHPARVRLYDRLFTSPTPDEEEGFTALLNPASLEVLEECRVEEGLGGAAPESHHQFERQGYFCADRHDSRPGALVFNRAVTLRDTWAKIAGKG